MVHCREVADNSKAQAQSDGTSLADKPEIILERLGFARPRQQQLVSTSPEWLTSCVLQVLLKCRYLKCCCVQCCYM